MPARTLALSLCLATLAACSGTDNTIDVCENFEISFTTLDRFQQPVSSFGTGEVIRFQHTVHNRSNSTQMVNGVSPGCGAVPIDVKDAAGKSVYYDGRDPPSSAAPCVTTPFQTTFSPGETKTYAEDWNQPSSGGQSRNLAAGTYTGEYSSYLSKCATTFDKKTAFSLR